MFVTVISRTLAGVYRSDCLASARPKSTIEQRAVRFQSGLFQTPIGFWNKLLIRHLIMIVYDDCDSIAFFLKYIISYQNLKAPEYMGCKIAVQ